MIEAHTVPGMVYQSLISIKTCFNGVCKIIYERTEIRAYYKKKLVLAGGIKKSTRLCLLPIAKKNAKWQDDHIVYGALGLQLSHM